jgi:serine/threonine protein kinase
METVIEGYMEKESDWRKIWKKHFFWIKGRNLCYKKGTNLVSFDFSMIVNIELKLYKDKQVMELSLDSNKKVRLNAEIRIMDEMSSKALFSRMIHSETSRACCAKVFAVDRGTEHFVAAESNSNDIIHQNGENINPFVVYYSEKLEFHHANRKMMALIMPLYPLKLADLLRSMDPHPLPVPRFLKLTYSLLSAGERFHEISHSHGDIKPSNVMFSNDGNFIVIDLGSVTTYGQHVDYRTLVFPLGEMFASPIYDLNCILVTLLMCSSPDIDIVSTPLTKEKVGKHIAGITEPDSEIYKSVLSICFTCPNCQQAKSDFMDKYSGSL